MSLDVYKSTATCHKTFQCLLQKFAICNKLVNSNYVTKTYQVYFLKIDLRAKRVTVPKALYLF